MKILKTETGDWSWRKILLTLMVPMIMFIAKTSYDRYSWIRDQAYIVATNKTAILEAKKHFEEKDKKLQTEIDKLKGVLHSRISKETDKREKGDERLLDLILDMLDQQQRSIKQQQDYIEQRTNERTPDPAQR